MKKNKMGVISIISIVVTVLLIFGFGLLSVLLMLSGNTEAAGWGIGLLLMLAFLILPYFVLLTIISIICDYAIKGSTLVKDIIIGILLFIPVVLGIILTLLIIFL